MYYIYIQTLHKHGACGHNYYLKTEAANSETALERAWNWVFGRLPYGATIVEDDIQVEDTLPAFDREDDFTLLEASVE